MLAANGTHAAGFGDKGKLAMPPARRFAILTCMDAQVIRNTGGRTLTEKTTIEWPYQPSSFFEAPVVYREPDYELRVEAGVATATLVTPADPVPPALHASIERKVHGLFAVRQLLSHTRYTLEGARTTQHRADGNRSVAMTVGTSALKFTAGQPDIVIQDSTGRVIKDTKAARIAEHQAFIRFIGERIGKHPLLDELLESYRSAVNDPANELIHLYEVRDALSKYYGNETRARKALGIVKAKWQRLGALSNDEPLKQGRHRGKHPGQLRHATPEELEEARSIARDLVEAFARTL